MIFPGPLLLKVFLFVRKTIFSEVILSLEKVELAPLLGDYFEGFSPLHFTPRERKRSWQFCLDCLLLSCVGENCGVINAPPAL